MNGTLAIAAVLTAVVVSALHYRHRGRGYAQGKDRRIRSPGSFRLVYRFIQVSTLFGGIAAGCTNHWLVLRFHDSLWVQLFGVAVAAVALLGFVRAKTTLGAEYSPCFDSFVPRRIVRTGLYRWIRHPIYTTNLALLFGLALATATGWIAFSWLLLLFYYNQSAREEERALANEFPEYRTYLAETGRFLPRRITGQH